MDKHLLRVSALLGGAMMLSIPALTSAQQMSILAPENHPDSPAFESAFPEATVSLDATLSWKNRFLGDERFNDSEVLEVPMTSHAKMQHHAMAGHEGHGAGMSMDGAGTIRQVRSDKLKIEHGPIDRLGMPPMTMVFKVSDTAMLEGLEKGQEIEFAVDNSSGGFVITHLMPKGSAMAAMNAGSAGSLDATGTVSQVRMDQAKVKIKHGPIERLGMPAMTMVFKVSDPAMLEGLSKDLAVEFSVDNSSGGFVITEIKPAQ